MDPSGPPRSGRPSTSDIQVVVEILEDLADWELVPDLWDEVDRLIGAIRAGWDAPDRDAFRAATADLESISTRRVIPIRALVLVPVPPPIRERANRLLHDVSDALAPGGEPRDRTPRP